MRLDGVFPDAAPSPGLSARSAAVLGWCSPKSSVPRQTVGHHARAANYEMGPTAACEGCRGEVPRRLDIPPTEALFSFPSYTHRPGRSGAHEPAGSGVDFPIPQNSFVWVWLKMGSRASKNPRVGSGVGHRSRREPNAALTVFLLPLAALPPPFSYTHRPGRSGAHEPAGSGVDFPIPQNSFVWRWLKMGSRARTRGARPARRPRPACAGCRMRAPGRPTLDPNRPTLHPALPHCLPPPAYPGPQPAYPIPPPHPPRTSPHAPTLHLPQHAYPRPRRRPPCTSPGRPTIY